MAKNFNHLTELSLFYEVTSISKQISLICLKCFFHTQKFAVVIYNLEYYREKGEDMLLYFPNDNEGI
jgi:hypothetical protein